MILEEIIGDVVATVIRENGQTDKLAVGDYFSDHERSSINAIGSGKLLVRVDANCTIEIRGIRPEDMPVPELPVEVPVVETPAPVETPAAVEEAPVEETPVPAPTAKK